MSHDFFETHIDQAPRDEDVREELKDLKYGIESFQESEKFMKNRLSLSKQLLNNLIPRDFSMMQNPGDIKDVFDRIDIHTDISDKPGYKQLALLSILISVCIDKPFEVNTIPDANFIDTFFIHLPEKVSEFQNKYSIKDTGVIDYITMYTLMSEAHKKNVIYTSESYQKILAGYTDHGRYVLNEQGAYTIDSGKESAYKSGKPRKGEYFHADGGHYHGEMIGGTLEGRGRYTFPNGDILEGEWQDNIPFGQMTYRRVDGDVYKGYSRGGMMGVSAGFDDTKSIGYGTYTFADGRSFSGLFEDNNIKPETMNRPKDTTGGKDVTILIPVMKSPQILNLKKITPVVAQSP